MTPSAGKALGGTITVKKTEPFGEDDPKVPYAIFKFFYRPIRE